MRPEAAYKHLPLEHGGSAISTQHPILEEKVQQQVFLAEHLGSLSQLSSGISHAIRNPMTTILLYVDILADEKRFGRRSAQELEILGEIRENTSRIVTTLTRILDYAQSAAPGQLPADVNRLLQNILKIWKPRMESLDIRLNCFLDADLPMVRANSIELQQVFSNLIVNGIEAMRGGGTLTIESKPAASRFHPGREIVLITFTDTGPGVAEEDRERIFHPFFTTKSDHTGLGLTIAHQIVHRHGGVLTCDGTRGTGAAFAIELNRDDQPGTDKV